jgi:hypothetical protein
MIMANSDWHGVPEEHRGKWIAVFSASQEILTLSAPCPICGAIALHRWYQAHRPIDDQPGFVARGGLWEWCSACRSFEHYSALVPDWWSCALLVDTKGLTPYPTTIEEAIKQTQLNARA